MFNGLKEELAKYLDERLDDLGHDINVMIDRRYGDISDELSARHKVIENTLADQHRSIEVAIGNDRAETDKKLEILNDKLRYGQGHNAEIAHNIRTIAKDKEEQLMRLQDTIESQQNTIERLSNALCYKYEKGLFIMTDSNNRPFVFRDGKMVDISHATDLTISWTDHEAPVISINQEIIC